MPSSYAVEAMDENDIVNAVNFAKENNLRLVVKGTGKIMRFLLFNIIYELGVMISRIYEQIKRSHL